MFRLRLRGHRLRLMGLRLRLMYRFMPKRIVYSLGWMPFWLPYLVFNAATAHIEEVGDRNLFFPTALPVNSEKGICFGVCLG